MSRTVPSLCRAPLWACAAVLLAAAAPAHAQVPGPAASPLPTLTADDYDRWETVRLAELSPDGRWTAYVVTRVDDRSELRIRNLATGAERVIPRGSRPLFSPDGRWIAWSVEGDGSDGASRPSVMAVPLGGGEPVVLGDVVDFAFSADSRYLMLRGFVNDGAGAPVTVRPLAGGAVRTYEAVETQAWSERGALLALVAVTDSVRSLRVFDGGTGATHVLDENATSYSNLTWHDTDLAVFRGNADGSHDVRVWRDGGVSRRGNAAIQPDHRLHSGSLGAGALLRVQEGRPLRWSADGATLWVGVDDAPRGDGTADPRPVQTRDSANVQVWHADDVAIVPERATRALIERGRGTPAAWHLSTDAVVPLADSIIDEVNLTRGRFALGIDHSRYDRERMFGPEYRDLYAIDTRTGERTRVAERVQHDVSISETGRYILYVRDGHYHTYDTQARRHAVITQGLATSFINETHDFTAPDKPPFGSAGWTPGDSLVLLHDRYDIWAVRPDGSGGRRLTDGAGERIRHRRIWLTPDERVVDLRAGAYALLYGETTKRTGFARVTADAPAERLLWVDAAVSRLSKADSADVLMYRVETFDTPPDYFVTGPGFETQVRATQTNGFIEEYAWGDARLVDYVDEEGRELQGALFYPANHDPSRTYPLIIYPYEIVSNTLHTFTLPSEQVPYNPTVWTQQGYFVLRPDVVFRARQPGVSSLETLHAALDAVLATGLVDSTRVGIIGHSWGGYQATFAATRSSRFAAAVAGAPISNMISMYGSIYWSTGGTDARMFELQQGRMEVPFWEDLPAYIDNSPLFAVPQMEVPLLVAFGDRDGSVDWHQGIELYNAARRAGKQLVMLVYPGENHTLARRGNVADYHYRVLEWFDHYLRGGSPAEWIVHGMREGAGSR